MAGTTKVELRHPATRKMPGTLAFSKSGLDQFGSNVSPGGFTGYNALPPVIKLSHWKTAIVTN